MALKFGKYLPKLIITEAVLEAFVDEDYGGLHVLADLKPVVNESDALPYVGAGTRGDAAGL